MRFEIANENRGMRLDVFLSHALGDVTRSQLQVLNRRGAIRVDGRREKAGYRLRGGEEIEIDRPEPEALRLEAEMIPFEVHFEDDSMAVVEKPAGIVVHPGAGNRSGTLVHALLARFPELSDTGGTGRPGIVHRLDKWTSGLILVAKNNPAHHKLSMSFQQRQVQKTYLALVHGRFDSKVGTIDLTIGRHPSLRTRMAAGHPRGRKAQSEYTVLEDSARFSLLKVRIHTGRTHQIRVHLSAIGHPVVGDATYGAKQHAEFVRKYGELNRYFLHATQLALPHPRNDEVMTFTSPLPEQLDRLWRVLRTAT